MDRIIDLPRPDPGSFDLVLNDMTMPEVTGVQQVQEIQAIRPSIPVIIVTGYIRTPASDVVKAIEK